jgi:hypothetical protein
MPAGTAPGYCQFESMVCRQHVAAAETKNILTRKMFYVEASEAEYIAGDANG